MSIKDGMNYAPKGRPAPVVEKGRFQVAALRLDHGHIYGMCNGLKEAGARITWVHDQDPSKVAAFLKQFPEAKAARSEEEALADPDVHLIAGAAIPSLRCELGLLAMAAGKDYFTDKTPFTSLSQLKTAKAAVERTGRKYMVYYSERLHVEEAIFAGQLIQQGAIGKVIQTLGLGPHRLNAKSRPDWFFKRAQYGGILCDIGSHQVEQFLYYTGSKDARITMARADNFANPEYPQLEDFGECSLVGDGGASGYYRVDWFTPDALPGWGDGRTIILGSEGYIELRKYLEVGSQEPGGRVYLVNKQQMQVFDVRGQVGFPFFGQLILDCLHRTENAMSQRHAFKAAELCLRAQELSDQARGIL